MRPSKAFRDLVIFALVTILVFVLSYFFRAFTFVVEIFQKNDYALTWIDEIITGLLTLSIGFAVFSWRRWRELKKETSQRIKLQEELLEAAETKAETERIICRELHCEIDELRKIEQGIVSRRSKTKA